jgi:hypothetical protein
MDCREHLPKPTTRGCGVGNIRFMLPNSSGSPVEFLMYPQAETADGRLDCLDPGNFKYEINSREMETA